MNKKLKKAQKEREIHEKTEKLGTPSVSQPAFGSWPTLKSH